MGSREQVIGSQMMKRFLFVRVHLPVTYSRRFPKTFMLAREKRSDRKSELFGELVVKMEQRQQRAHNGSLAKDKNIEPSESAHGAVPAEPQTQAEILEQPRRASRFVVLDGGAEHRPIHDSTDAEFLV